jgi:hypothetical protein
MTKLKTAATTALAAATIGVGGLVAAPSASAAAMSCSHAMNMHQFYMATGDVFFALGQISTAAAYYGRASGVLEAAC